MVPERTWARLCQSGIRREFRGGEPIFVSGAPATSVLLLTSGRVEVGCRTESGDYRLIALRGADDVIGEVALHVGGSRTADVFAVESCEAFSVPEATFRRVLTKDGVHDQVSRYMADKLRRAGQDTVEMMSLPPLQRVARLMVNLVDLADPAHDPMRIPLSQARIGQLLGLSRSLVAKLVAYLRTEGVLGDARTLTVERMADLRQFTKPQ